MTAHLMRRFLAIGIQLMLFCAPALSQHHTLSGYLQDGISGERIIAGAIICPELEIGAYTNEFGFYSLSLPTGSHSLIAKGPGYESLTLQIFIAKDSILHIQLSALQLDEVEIVADPTSGGIEDAQMSTITISGEDALSMPALAGEVDILKTLQLMPGIQGGNEGNAGLYVRGGGPDQNLTLVDGVPIYQTAHLFGFLSNFNADAISHMDMMKGDFPAMYGGRLSSVLDVRLKDGNMDHFQGAGSIGLLSANISLEGPIKRDKASFFASLRYAYPDLFIRPISKVTSRIETDRLLLYDQIGYRFFDGSIKAQYRPSASDRIQLSLFHGKDLGSQFGYLAITEEQETYTQIEQSHQEFGWSNAIASIQWNHILSQRFSSNLTLYANQYRLFNQVDLEIAVEEQGVSTSQKQLQSFSSGITDWAGKWDLFGHLGQRHDVRFGIGAIRHQFEVGTQQYAVSTNQSGTDTTLGTQPIHAWELDAYASDEWKLHDQVTLRLGTHAAWFLVNDQSYLSIQPRASVVYRLHEQGSLKASFAQTVQHLHLLTNSGVGLPTDLWVPPTEKILPQQAWQGAIGTQWNHNKGFTYSLEGYFKRMYHTLAYQEGASFLEVGRDWQSQVVSGQGWAYGIEQLVRKHHGRMTGWLGYTLAWSNRQSDQINQGNIYPAKFDRRHDLAIAAVYKWKPHIQFSANWTYSSGNVVTLPIAQYHIQSPYYHTPDAVFHYEGRNNYRMPASHRLDISVKFIRKKTWGTRTWTLGLYNAYNRQNPYYLEIAPDYTLSVPAGEAEPNVLWQQSLFPILPSVNYRITFGS
ncbi:TonB-dependent receptor plug domain-containing protein [Pontibacter sp. G13]|uniref:TonB-dependent receptor n=1 Tax=Pontibacter sp. G13 TaxID=3074898 RepID=UPI00288A046D|nr:TonB-dependent receptor plug domain-containing protein [Pontibacter sp. G13]WNJ17173.1 TonB-dependent receptor plug domain-containing protein [Pontibacter sp. G13]